jgi:hypothetical protein
MAREGKSRAAGKHLSSSVTKNIRLYRISELSYVTSIPAHQRGGRTSSRTRAGSRWTRPASARRAVAGWAFPAHERPGGARRTRLARTAKACGPGARSLCVKSCGEASARPGLPLSQQSAGRRWQECIAHRGEYAISRQATAQGRLGCLGCPVISLCILCASSLPHRAHGCQPAPGLPCALRLQEGNEHEQSSGKSRRENAKTCLFSGILSIRLCAVTPASAYLSPSYTISPFMICSLRMARGRSFSG